MDINVGQLQAISEIFHLIHHRNKNQHRQSTWWKWLAMLKRSIVKLIVEIEHKDYGRALARLKYMKDLLLPRCYAAFTQIIQDNQFSALGLTLLAELARSQCILRAATVELEELEYAQLKTAGNGQKAPAEPSEDLGQTVGRSTPSSSEIEAGPRSTAAKNSSEPLATGSGSALFQGPEDILSVDSLPRLREESRKASAAKRIKIAPKAAKRQKGKFTNSIDDLFQGLEYF